MRNIEYNVGKFGEIIEEKIIREILEEQNCKVKYLLQFVDIFKIWLSKFD